MKKKSAYQSKRTTVFLIGIVFMLFVTSILIYANVKASERLPDIQVAEQANKADKKEIEEDYIASESADPKLWEENIDEYNRIQSEVDKKMEEENERNAKVAELLHEVPVKGNKFTLDFDYDKGKFKLKLDKNNQEEGKKNHKEFLKSKKIDDPSWIKDIEIETE